ncbi:MAG: sulfotransferase family protein [Thermoguttaceae bacterium]
MSVEKSSITKVELGGYKDRFWYPRMWNGMTLSAWLKILGMGHYRIAPRRMCMAGIIGGCGVLNSSLALIEKMIYGNKISQTKLNGPPIFIVGHWRSGTTLLHEYMILDPQFTFADTYSCFTPAHFLVSNSFLRPMVSVLMPKKRPIDNMAFGFDRPQEDEFALCALGVPTPYMHLLFANDPPLYQKFLTLRDVSDEQRKEWLDTLDWFLRALTVRTPKQIVLKSPTHTARIRTLLEKYPDAKFIHIHRDPYKLFPSTYNLWLRLSKDEGLQVPTGEGLEEYVLSTFEEMYSAFEADVPLLKPDQFTDISFRELTKNPAETISKIYSDLKLGDFEPVRGKIEEFANSQREYKKNKFEISPEIAEKIKTRWSGYIKKYNY